MGVVVSVLLHALIIGLLIVPFVMPGSVIERIQQGAGGAGPAGGGGGGSHGNGGTVETVRFVRLVPDQVPTPTSIPPKTEPVVPKAEAPKPTPVETPKPKPPEPQQQSGIPAAPATVASVVSGAGGGSGADGSVGAGPGTGGGVGSGKGTGNGSANGPGTGGGTQANHPPTVVEMFLPPLPAPKDVQGIHFIANFDVDSTGRVIDFRFTQTPNRDYNKRLADALRATRFRPGTRPDGTPVRMTGQITWDF